MSKTTVLVPIDIEAILVNKYSHDEKKLSVVSPNYKMLEYTSLGSKIVSKPFTLTKPLAKGVHLHFILPSALTHGVETSDGFVYPSIPNRWLVTRIIKKTGTDNPIISHQTWVVESDYVGKDNKTSVVLPTLGQDDDDRYRYLGRCYKLGTNPKKGGTLTNLTVLGTGDPTFSAYYPSCHSVLGFYDSLDGINAEMLSYSVFGYYSDEKNNPLYGIDKDGIIEKLEEQRWDIDTSLLQYPLNTICHGNVSNLDWRGDTYSYPSGMPVGAIDISFGNTSVEALSALLSKNLSNTSESTIESKTINERLLNTLQYDLIELYDELDGIQKVEDKLFERSFSQEQSGKVWRLTASSDSSSDTKKELPRKYNDYLFKLNRLQKEKDNLSHQYETAKETLHYIWHTYVDMYEEEDERTPPPFTKQEVYDEFKKEEKNLKEILVNIEKKNIAIEELIKVTKAELKKDELNFMLETTVAEFFYKPNDPVVLFSGDGISRSFIYGEDGRFSEENKLQLRTLEQCVSQISNINVEGKLATIHADNLSEFLQSSITDVKYPSWFSKLFYESIFLDKNSSRILAEIAFCILEKDYSETQIGKLSKEIADKIANNDFSKGIVPSAVSVNVFEMSRPRWNTLFLEWKVGYYPTRTDEKPDNSMKNWEWNGIDFDYKGTFPTPPEVITIEGRTVITPHSQYVLQNTLKRCIEDYDCDKDTKEQLIKMAKQLSSLKILSQSLSGFTNYIISRQAELNLPIAVLDDIFSDDELIAEMTQTLKNHLEHTHINSGNSEKDNYEKELYSPINSNIFYPIRAGFMNIIEMKAINSFGQKQIYGGSLNNIIVSETITPKQKFEKVVSLSPRLAFPAKLSFEWISAENEKTVNDSEGKQEFSPVCGYVIANKLNRGLMVYDDEGILLGNVQIIYRDKMASASWVPMPKIDSEKTKEAIMGNVEIDSEKEADTSVSIYNDHLRQFVDSIVSESKSYEALSELLLSIDKWQSTIFTENASHDEDISILNGRPIAIMRAELSLQSAGKLPYKMKRKDFGQYETNDFDAQTFYAYIGDGTRKSDGLIGYFPDKKREVMYNMMQAGYKNLKPAKVTPAYINYETKTKLDFHKNKSVKMTLLVEVMSNITIKTGILPTKTVLFPEEYCKDALQSMYQGFEINPVICSEDEIMFPVMPINNGEWFWLNKNEAGEFDTKRDILPVHSGFTQNDVCIMDGFLLKNNE